MQPIHDACLRGHLDVVKWLAQHYDVLLTVDTKSGRQPVHWAIVGGHLELVKWLSGQEGASFTANDKVGSQPIHLACRKGHLNIVKWLSEQKGVSLTVTYIFGQPIYEACLGGHLDVVKWLSEQEGVSLTVKKKNGRQPIHDACWQGHLDVIKWLAQQEEVSLTAEDNRGDTALHVAASSGHVGVVSMLLDAEADVNAKLPSGITALHTASGNGHAGVISVLLKARADVHAKHEGDWTPLHFAVRTNLQFHCDGCKREIVDNFWTCDDCRERSFDYSFDYCETCHNNFKCGNISHLPRHTSSLFNLDDKTKGVFESVSALLKAGSEVNAKDIKGFTTLHSACRLGNTITVRILLEGKADPHSCNKFQQTPLHNTSSSKNAEMLLNRNANVNTRDMNGWRPLHFAAKQGCVEVAEFLVHHKADIRARTSNGKIPLDLCEEAAAANSRSNDLRSKDQFQELLNILKQAARNKPGGLSRDLMQMHEQSAQGAYSPLLNVKQFNDNDAQSVLSSRASVATTKSAASALPLLSSKGKDCSFWLKGVCRKGDNCNFIHDPQKQGIARAGQQVDGSAGGTRFIPPGIGETGHAASTPTRPLSSNKRASAPRANVATTSKNPFSMLEERGGDDE